MTADLRAIIARMRSDRARFQPTYGSAEVVWVSTVDDWADELEELVAAHGWQPIETAPKDQRVLAVLKPHPGEANGEITFVYRAKTGDAWVWTYDDCGEACEPIAWMPLPAAPEGA